MKYLSLIITLSLGLGTGCATLSGAENSQNLAKLKYGMKQNQVLSLLGTPDSIIRQSKLDDRWIYEFRKPEKRGQNMYVDFKNGLLAKTGELTGREVAAAEETRIPGTCSRRIHPEAMQESLCTR